MYIVASNCCQGNLNLAHALDLRQRTFFDLDANWNIITYFYFLIQTENMRTEETKIYIYKLFIFCKNSVLNK